MKEFLGSKRLIYGMFIVITLIQLGHIIYTFQVKKESLNSDEVWSYCYANSYYQSSIYYDESNNDEGLVKNLEEWVPGKELWDCMVVNKGEAFTYGSVIDNHMNDLSPPFHSMVLHTICSFFPETFSWWYGFSINVVAFLITMFFLFRAVSLLQNSYIALTVCSFYGFTQNCIDNFIYIRPYAICTAFFMIILYQTMRIITTKGKENISSYIWMGIVSFLGFLSHYYFIIAVGILTVCVCLYLLFKKDYKKMFCFGGVMLAALVLMLAVFPSVLHNAGKQIDSTALITDGYANYNFRIRYELVLNTMLNTVICFGIPIYKSGYLRIGLGICVFACIIMLPLLYLFRDTILVQRIFQGIKSFAHRPFYYIKKIIMKLPWCYILIMLLIALYSLVVSETSKVAGMGSNERRYTFFMTPVMVIFLVCFLGGCLKCILKKHEKLSKGILSVIIVGFIGLNFIVYYYNMDTAFYFLRNSENMRIEETVQDCSVIFLEKHNWLIYAIADRFIDADEYFQVSSEKYQEYEQEYIEKLNDGKPVVLVFDVSFLGSDVDAILNETNTVNYEVIEERQNKLMEEYNEIIAYFESLVPDTEMELLTKEEVFTRPMEVYRINP